MALDATGTPTSLGIPKYNTSVDAPSGNGFNAAMDAINALLGSRATETLTQNNATALTLSGAAAGLTIGGDTTLYRSAAGTLRTDGIFQASELDVDTGNFTLYKASPGNYSIDSWATNGSLAFRVRPGGTMTQALKLNTDGRVLIGPAGAEASLYASASAELKTASLFRAGTDIYARDGLATQVRIGDDGATRPGIIFGSASDTSLYRLAAGEVATDGYLHVGLALEMGGGVSSTAIILESALAADGFQRFQLDKSGKMVWGPGNAAVDTNLYRAGVGVVRTDGTLRAGSNVYSNYDGEAIVLALVSGKAGVLFGSAQDVNLYRSVNARLTTDSDFTGMKNILVGGVASDGGGVGVLCFAAVTTAPAASPGAGVLYSQAGALKYKGSSGTVTTIAPA